MEVFRALQSIELSRRNLETLLASLDVDPEDNVHAINRQGWTVYAVENEAHYGKRLPGKMPPHIEEAIKR